MRASGEVSIALPTVESAINQLRLNESFTFGDDLHTTTIGRFLARFELSSRAQNPFRLIPITTGDVFPFDSIEKAVTTLCSSSFAVLKASLIRSSGMSETQSH